jgi:hypothetical protein
MMEHKPKHGNETMWPWMTTLLKSHYISTIEKYVTMNVNFIRLNVPQEMRRLGQQQPPKHRPQKLLSSKGHDPLVLWSMAIIIATFCKPYIQSKGLFPVLQNGWK